MKGVAARPRAGSLPGMTSTPHPRTRLRQAVEALAPVVAVLLLVVLLHTFVLQPFTIPSGSMAPTLLTGDYILVSKGAYGWSRAPPPVPVPGPAGRIMGRLPRRGDVVVFRLPRDPSQVWVKRVIGLPGDRVRVAHGVVEVDGRALRQAPLGVARDADDPRRPVRRMRETGADGRTRVIQRALVDGEGDDTGVYVVPPGRVFAMGDNRDNSLDSRWPGEVGVGFLPIDDILGRADWVVMSWRPGAALAKPWTWLNLRLDRLLKRLD